MFSYPCRKVIKYNNISLYNIRYTSCPIHISISTVILIRRGFISIEKTHINDDFHIENMQAMPLDLPPPVRFQRRTRIRDGPILQSNTRYGVPESNFGDFAQTVPNYRSAYNRLTGNSIHQRFARHIRRDLTEEEYNIIARLISNMPTDLYDQTG